MSIDNKFNKSGKTKEIIKDMFLIGTLFGGTANLIYNITTAEEFTRLESLGYFIKGAGFGAIAGLVLGSLCSIIYISINKHRIKKY